MGLDVSETPLKMEYARADPFVFGGKQDMKKNILAVLLGCLLAVILVEVIFQALPVSDATSTMDVNDANPYMRFEPNRSLDISIGKFFEIRSRKKTNNWGFFDDKDFRRGEGKGKLVVIGDSYVEALQVKNAEAIHGRLSAALDSQYDVYGIGSSGSPLSQYLAYAKFARAEFDPSVFVFVVVANDYDESLLRYKQSPGYHYYDDNFQLERVDYRAGMLKTLLRFSATVRYFAINLRPYSFIGGARQGGSSAFVANVPAMVDEVRVSWSKRAVDRFMSDLKVIVGDKPVFFVVDGLREYIYRDGSDSQEKKSYAYVMNQYFIQQSEASRFFAIDLHPIFRDDYFRNGERFEFETNAHWNARGHELAAEAVRLALSQRGLLWAR